MGSLLKGMRGRKTPRAILSWDREKGNIASRGGARIGDSRWNAVNYTYPLIVIRFLRDGLCLTAPLFSREWFIRKDDVVRIAEIRSVFPGSSGYRIEHSSPQLPPTIIFWSFCDASLQRKFRLWERKFLCPRADGKGAPA